MVQDCFAYDKITLLQLQGDGMIQLFTDYIFETY